LWAVLIQLPINLESSPSSEGVFSGVFPVVSVVSSGASSPERSQPLVNSMGTIVSATRTGATMALVREMRFIGDGFREEGEERNAEK
jgi:hypothetical protein